MILKATLLIVILITCSCKKEIGSNKNVSLDDYRGVIHKNSELTFYDDFFKKYKQISKGNKTIFEISYYHENLRNATDSGSSIQLYFTFKNNSLKVGDDYYLQNDDILNTYCLQRGASIGMRKLYGVCGKFKIVSSNNTILKIKILGEITADDIRHDKPERYLIIKDTVLEFRE